MQKIFYILCIVAFSNALIAQPCTGNFLLSTQLDIDNFSINHPNCTQILGKLRISGNDIKNLNGLSQLTSVSTLEVCNNPSLNSLFGLHNLSGFIGEVRVDSNLILEDFNGLNGIKSIGGIFGGNLEIRNNSSIKNFDGLNSLISVGSDIIIKDNESLLNLVGLDSLQFVGSMNSDLNIGHVIISNNKSLKNLYGLNNLDTITKGLDISFNPSLLSLTGLNNLNYIGKWLDIWDNDVLLDLEGLQSLYYIGESFEISHNDSLKIISNLEKLNHVGTYFKINDNYTLKNITGINNLDSIGSYIEISENSGLMGVDGFNDLSFVKYIEIVANGSLIEFNGFDNLNSIESIRIGYNDSIIVLNAFHNLSMIEGDWLEVIDNKSLVSLDNFKKLNIIKNDLRIGLNNSLVNLDGLENLNYVGRIISIADNQSLHDCAIDVVCNYLLHKPDSIVILNNATGCNSIKEVEDACGAIPVYVQVLMDSNNNCQPDSSDIPVSDVHVQLSGNMQTSQRPTFSNGIATFNYLGNEGFSLTLPQFPTANWQACQDSFWVNPDSISGTIKTTFLLHPLNQCPELTLDLGLPFAFRSCSVTSDVNVSIKNTGTTVAKDVKVGVVMPEILELVTSSPLFNSKSGDTLYFVLGDLLPLMTTSVQMIVKTKCDTYLMGQTLCMEAFADFSNPCPSTVPSYSEIKLLAQCIGDTLVRFAINNVGDAPTKNSHNYVIIKNTSIVRSENFNLNAHQSMTIDVVADGSTYRMEATKYDDGTLTSTAFENCGGFTPGLITAFWLDEGPLNYDFDCRQIISSFDPNQKTAIPTGSGPNHLLSTGYPLHYTIDFQNTGTDTAYRILLRDILPAQLDVSTFRPGFASHPYVWEIRGLDTLEVLFEHIALPDSNTNEVASHGFFSFDICQNPSLLGGTVIENAASIIFDYNLPIMTNTVIHTIGATVRVEEPKANTIWRILSNPTRDQAVFLSTEMVRGVKCFELLDINGRIMRSEYFTGQEFVFQRHLLPSGLYFFRITDTTQGLEFSGKIFLSE